MALAGSLPPSVRSMIEESVTRSVTAIASIMPSIAEIVGSSDLFNVHKALDALRIVWMAERHFGLPKMPLGKHTIGEAAFQRVC